ncbi:MAG: hypothetical protein OXQ94_08990 [Gemmatimonadota bacterium]|nr:hypothetical protein [Gemmatimonadota bacterium]MDE2871806.1 hypothetical protein [Gemmatimonadota bacterium]
MAKPANGRTRILLSAAMAAELAALPPDLTAQAGPGEPGRSLAAWMEQARENPFHGSTQTGTPENPTAAPGVGIGMTDTHDMSRRPPPVPDNAVSPGRVFAFTLAGATIPLIPAMVNLRPTEVVLGVLATLVTVPVAAASGGVDSLPLNLAGTVVGFLFGVGAAGVTRSEVWAVPVFSVTWASVATLITTG